jgi:hypothetical protein
MLRKKLEIDKVEGDVVLLKGGLKLTMSKFKAMSGDSLAVYCLSGKGELSTTTAPATVKYTQSKPISGARGGAEQGSAYELAQWVEGVYKDQPKEKKNAYQAVMAYTYFLAMQMGDDSVDICKKLVAGMSAGARSSFYTIFSPYCEFGLSNLDPEFVSQCLGMKRDMPACFESYPAFYVEYRDSVIKKADCSVDLESRKKDQQDVIHRSSANTVVYQVKKQYEDNMGKLARDLFSVYNYLALVMEASEDNYYNSCFLWIVRNVYTSISDITEHSLDLAYNMTIYGNLVRSDAYKYCPIDSKTVMTGYESLGLVLPSPTMKEKLFSIEQNKDTNIHGGDDVRSVADLDQIMMGGNK